MGGEGSSEGPSKNAWGDLHAGVRRVEDCGSSTVVRCYKVDGSVEGWSWGFSDKIEGCRAFRLDDLVSFQKCQERASGMEIVRKLVH